MNVYVIAAHARRFGLLAERPALLYPEPSQRIERVMSDETKTPLDVMLLGGASEADRVCAAAVVALRQDAPQSEPVLSLLSVLPADYLLGVYFALPVERRGQCETDPVWAYHLRRVPDGIEEAMDVLDSLAEADLADLPEQILEGDEAAAFRRFSEDQLREQLGVAGNGD